MSSENRSFPYHEIDFLLPAHRFKINFSYVSKKGLPFIREFVLRLVHLSPMKPVQIAKYFDLSKRETHAAISDLVTLGDLEYLDDGSVGLSKQARGYFDSLGDIPSVSRLLEYSGVFSFELADFNCIGRNRTNEKWKNAIGLEIASEKLSVTEKTAKHHFQSQFYALLDKGIIKGLEDNSETDAGGRPSIYKIELVKKIFQEHFRLTQTLSMDQYGKQIERDDLENLDETSEISELITQAIHKNSKADNKPEIFMAMGTIGDDRTQLLLKENHVDITKLLQVRLINDDKETGYYPFLGSIYSKQNWVLFLKHLDIVIKQSSKNHQDGVDDLIWVAPSDSFWGKSTYLPERLGELIAKSTVTKDKNTKTLFKPKMYVPLRDDNDRRSKSDWIRELSGHDKYIHGLAEGFLSGNVEVLLLPGQLAVICYHISFPDTYDVTLPLGFISTEEQVISKITKLVQEYLEGMQGFDRPNDLGLIK